MSTPPSQVGFSADGNCDNYVDILFQHFCCNGGNESAHQAPTLIQGHQFEPHLQEVMKESEDLIAAAVSNLTLQERLKAEDEIHCVGEVVEETQEMIDQKLAEFQEVLRTTPHNQIYHAVALNQNRSYVEATSFRLKFLRKNLFDVRKSVNNMMKFLKHKELWFGDVKVAQDIGPEDMNEEEIVLMRSGSFQILKDRDPSGRVILYHSPIRLFKHLMHINDDERKLKTLIHVLYHIIFNVLIEMEDVQTKGVVVIFYEESKRDEILHPGFTFQRKVDEFLNSLPFRITSQHLCFHSLSEKFPLFNKILQVALKAMPERALPRTRIHYGSDMERQYKLRTYGIPIEKNFPVDQEGNIQTAIQQTWCQRSDEYLENNNEASMNDVEEQQAPRRDENEICPAHVATSDILETDVLFGRGRLVNHPGNVRYRVFLDAHMEVFESIPRHSRTNACIGYTQELISSGTRFLRQTETDDDLWVACDFNQSVDKVSQYFRTCRRKRRQREARLNP